jgi:hypothetical protein
MNMQKEESDGIRILITRHYSKGTSVMIGSFQYPTSVVIHNVAVPIHFQKFESLKISDMKVFVCS